MPGTAENRELARTRTLQVFQFLKAFAERNVPVRRTIAEHPWSLVFADLPRHPSIAIGEPPIPGSEDTVDDADERAEAGLVLRVRRPPLTSAPRPPGPLEGWLQPGWENPNGRVEVVRERNERRGTATIAITFSSDRARVAALEAWRADWSRWAEAEKPARAAMRVFERLYELRGRIELESERVELILGDGWLRWQRPDGTVNHPILLQRADLEFDPDVPEFRVVDADKAPELYRGLLQDADSLSPEKLNELRSELEKGGYHPLGTGDASGYLRRLVQLLGPRGEFHESSTEPEPGTDPVIVRSPVLFLRTRVSGFPAAFERVLEDLERRDSIPVSLSCLVGVDPPPRDDLEARPSSPWGEPPEILLSKPANQEQIAIVRALDRHRAVLVQGPPGTGKSHTIANLIGHLVAQGKRVLVTSHTTKALRVLRDLVPKTLQPLCVAVLEQDVEARRQMEQSVRAILSRLTTAREETLFREVERLSDARDRLNEEIDAITLDLRTAREAEYVPIVIAGESIDPVEAARRVCEYAEGNGWIPGPVAPLAPPPLDSAELADLYGTNVAITREEELEIEGQLPDPRALLTVERFSAVLTAIDATEPPELAGFWSRPPSHEELPGLETFHRAVHEAASDLARLEPWQWALVAAGHAGGSEQELWTILRDRVMDAAGRWDAARRILLEHDVTIDAGLPADIARARIDEILKHLARGGSLGWLALLRRPGWKELLRKAQVNGSVPSTQDHFRAIQTHVELEAARRSLATLWARQAEPVGLPPFDAVAPPAEPKLREYMRQVDALLGWWRTRWSTIASAAAGAGFKWSEFREWHVARSAPATPFEQDSAILAETLPRTVEARLAVADRDAALRLLEQLVETLSPYESPVCVALSTAVRERDVAKYREALDELWRIAGKYPVWQRRTELLERLGASAAIWAEKIRHRDGIHGNAFIPGDDIAAWYWRQLHQELERRASLDERRLSLQLHQRRDQLRAATAELIDRRAWLGQLRRTDLLARQALQGWADTQRKIGKGTGKRAPQLQAKARDLLAKARDAVPVWIMPLARVAESFDPRGGRFDVVILDEASQSDVTGLLAWYLADSVVVVGDHEQVSPVAVGQDLAATTTLIAQHLMGIPNNHLYDGQTSIYDLARQSFGGTIALREHFRCVPDIIEFSNWFSYDGEIRPLRDPASAARPHVVEYVVSAAAATGRSGKTNIDEARAIAALVAAAVDLPDYAGQTLGAITLLGDEQAWLIQDLALDVVGAMQLESRRFAAGNAAQFQGDERDVVFLSMVDTPRETPLALNTRALFKQRYNVAASRARNQLWLVHSLDPNRDLKAGDFRRALIEFVRDPTARRRAMQEAERRAESPFELAVMQDLIGRGYRVTPQVWVGSYRIDMVVSDGTRQVAVECDGDRFHGVDKIPEDMARQAVLERAGWRFIRIRGTRYYRDPEGTMAVVCQELSKLGVTQAPPLTMEHEADVEAEAFRLRVVRRAQEIMRERDWLQNDLLPKIDPLSAPEAAHA